MARANVVQTNFTAGELSPAMYGRVDIAKYFNGARKLQGCICLPQGGTRRTPGTKYLGGVRNSSHKTLVRPFHYSRNDTYVLEFGHQIMRVWQSGARLGAPVEVVTPYGQDDLVNLRFAQSADTMFIACAGYYPRVLTRTDSTTWTLDVYDNLDGPYLSVTPEATMQLTDVVDRATATAPVAIFPVLGVTEPITAVATGVSGTDTWAMVTTSTAHATLAYSFKLIRGAVGTPEINGAWVVFALSANTYLLIGCRKSPASVYTSGGTVVPTTVTHVEFREDNKWKLAQLIDVTSTTVATVDVIDAILYPDPQTKTTFGNTSGYSGITAAATPTFGMDSIGKHMRPTTVSAAPSCWAFIHRYLDSLQAQGTQTLVPNFDDTSKTVAITGRTITATLTASVATFVSSDVGRFVRLKYGANWVVATITAYTSSTVVSVSLEQDVPIDSGAVYKWYNDGKTDNWKFGAWSSTTGYPSSVSFHQNRLVWASTVAEPSTKWFTMSGDYYSFEPSDPETGDVNDDHAITVTLLSRQVDVVRWMDTGPVLLTGTEGSEWQTKPSSIQQVLTPTNISATLQTAYGSANLDANRIGAQTLFIDRTGLKLREMTYDFSIDAFVTKDISILSEHILREHNGVVDWSIQRSPYTIIWLVMGDGSVATVTYEKDHEVIAWSMQDIGGTVESVCAAASSSGEDDVYFVVKRTINGVDVRYVEMITGIQSDGSVYLNCYSATVYGNSVLVGYSAPHLPAAIVGVMVDGVYIGDKTADGTGLINITYSGYTLTVDSVAVGLRNTCITGLLDPEGGSQAGSSQAKKKRVSESSVRLDSSWYPKIAVGDQVTNVTENLTASVDPTSSNYQRITPAFTILPTTPGTNPSVETITFVTGDVAFSPDDSFDGGGRVWILQDEPYPLNITAVMQKLNTME